MTGAIVMDIEGTTTSVSFVYDVLFPYAREHMPAFVMEHGTEPAVAEQLEAVNSIAGEKLDTRQAVAQLLKWMDEDRKLTPLKAIQGMIWEEGYNKGGFTGHVCDEVPANLERWREAGIALYVYSSGSIRAQKLLFSHTRFGDLTPYFKDFFDTTTGNKRECASYRRIAETIGQKPDDIVFLSDVTEELDAASEAGFRTVLVDRDGDKANGIHKRIHTFDELRVD